MKNLHHPDGYRCLFSLKTRFYRLAFDSGTTFITAYLKNLCSTIDPDPRARINPFIYGLPLATFLKIMQLIINGQQQSYDGPMNVQQLVEKLSLQNKRFAIERNGEIIPRSQFPEQLLNEGDQLEIIVAVGGG